MTSSMYAYFFAIIQGALGRIPNKIEWKNAIKQLDKEYPDWTNEEINERLRIKQIEILLKKGGD